MQDLNTGAHVQPTAGASRRADAREILLLDPAVPVWGAGRTFFLEIDEFLSVCVCEGGVVFPALRHKVLSTISCGGKRSKLDTDF